MSLAIVLTARPSYSKLRPVIKECVARGLLPSIYVSNGALLHRFGSVIDQVRQDFPNLPIYPIYAEFDGYTLETSGKSTAALLSSLSDAFSWHKPSVVLVNHDRREVLAAAMAAAYQNIPVAHIGGGERSGNIDDRVRDAITCLSTYHFPATVQATQRVNTMMGWSVIAPYGCPSIDVAREALIEPPVTAFELGGVGPTVDPSRPFLLILQHPHTKEPEEAFRQQMTTLNAAKSTKIPTIVMWPGMDAGAEGAAKAIRLHQGDFHSIRTLPPNRFLRLMSQAACLVGNSSAGIRESGYLGTPVVNIGNRQQGRECGNNVLTVPHDFEEIRKGIGAQCAAIGDYFPISLYGDGHAAKRIAERLSTVCGL